MSGSQLITPKSFTTTHFEVSINRNAKAKFIITVVPVKNRFGNACFHFLYLKLNSGKIPSKNQNKVIPPTNIILLCFFYKNT